MTDQIVGISTDNYKQVLVELQHYKELFQNIAALGITYQRESYTCCTTTTMTGDLMMANAFAKHETAVPAGNTLVQTSARQQRLTHDFMLWIRITSGKTIIRRQPTDIAPIIRNSIKSAAESPYVKTAPLEIVPVIETTAPRQIFGEAQYLNFVLERLIENAIIYSPPKTQVQITVQEPPSLPKTLPPGAYAQITISDSGYGIPEHEQANMFTMFHRTQSNMSRNPNGAGTSLATCQLIVNTIGGHIALHSQAANKDNSASGTAVVLTLPSVPSNSN